MAPAVEIDARVIGEVVDGRDAAVGVEVSELRGLVELDLARIVGGAHRELVRAPRELRGPGELARRPVVVLARARAIEEAVEHFVLSERVVVEVAVQRRRLDMPVVRARGERQAIREVMRGGEVHEQRLVRRRVGLGVDARVVLREEALLLQSVAGEIRVGIPRRHGSTGPRVAPAGFGEELSHARRRIVAPSVFPEEIAGDVPIESVGVASAVLELGGPSRVRAVVTLH